MNQRNCSSISMSRWLPDMGGLCRTFALPVAACDRNLIHSNVGCRGLPSVSFLFFRLTLAAAWLPVLSDQALQQGALAGIGSAKHKTLQQHAHSVLSCLLLCVVQNNILPGLAAPDAKYCTSAHGQCCHACVLFGQLCRQQIPRCVHVLLLDCLILLLTSSAMTSHRHCNITPKEHGNMPKQ